MTTGPAADQARADVRELIEAKGHAVDNARAVADRLVTAFAAGRSRLGRIGPAMCRNARPGNVTAGSRHATGRSDLDRPRVEWLTRSNDVLPPVRPSVIGPKPCHDVPVLGVLPHRPRDQPKIGG